MLSPTSSTNSFHTSSGIGRRPALVGFEPGIRIDRSITHDRAIGYNLGPTGSIWKENPRTQSGVTGSKEQRQFDRKGSWTTRSGCTKNQARPRPNRSGDTYRRFGELVRSGNCALGRAPGSSTTQTHLPTTPPLARALAVAFPDGYCSLENIGGGSGIYQDWIPALATMESGKHLAKHVPGSSPFLCSSHPRQFRI